MNESNLIAIMILFLECARAAHAAHNAAASHGAHAVAAAVVAVAVVVAAVAVADAARRSNSPANRFK